jgi:hypothetical protein
VAIGGKVVQETVNEAPNGKDRGADVSSENVSGNGKIKIGQLIDLAKQGRKEILPTLRHLLDIHPEIWQESGDLAFRVQSNWLHAICGNNLYQRECLKRWSDELESKLAGPESSPLEQLQAVRIVALNLQLGYYEALLTKYEAKASEKVAAYLHGQCISTDSRLQQAMMNLARIRKLLPRVVKIELVVSGEVQTTIKGSADNTKSNSPEMPVHIRVPENRIKDLLAAVSNN